ncbi:MAG: homoserine kinase [Sarcina sp.]
MIYRVKVPATSANIGAGFDTMGIALNLYNIFEIEEIESGLSFNGFEKKYENNENLLYKAMTFLFERVKYKPCGYKISLIEQNIPVARGLGSSSTCIVAGILAANKITGENLNMSDLINLATEMEGHPDNVVTALLGGFTVSVVEKSKVYYNRVEIEENLSFFAAIPNFELETSISRKILPKNYNLNDIIFNISRSALTTAAFFSKNYEQLDISCADVIHEPYRKNIITNYDQIISFYKQNGIKCNFLSGAGPTILGIGINDNNNIFIKSLDNFKGWGLKMLYADNTGAIVEER